LPCNDITEAITLTIGADDRLADYALSKRTCGQAVGARALLLEWLQGRRIDDIVALEPVDVGERYPDLSQIEEFLALKHLYAVQSAAAVLLGTAPGGPYDACAAAVVSHGEESTTIDARIAVDVITKRIKSCGGCKGCGRKPRAAKRAVAGRPANTRRGSTHV